MGAGYEFATIGDRIGCFGKKNILDYMTDYMDKNPGMKRYCFFMDKKNLEGAELTKEDLDAICPDGEIQIQEGQGHSIWVNSKILERHGITDDTLDPVPGISFYVRKDGHVTGEMSEGAAEMPVILDCTMERTDEEIDAALKRWIDFSVNAGVSSVFDAGIPGFNELHERIYKRLRALDQQGRLPVYVDGCFVISSPREEEEGLKELERLRREYNTEHLKVHTLKIFMDGTLKLHSGAMVTPYVDTGELGTTAYTTEELAALLIKLNAKDLDIHLHTVGEASSRVVLDAVEKAEKELKDSLHIKVTSAHLQIQDDADLDRFAKLNVIANFTPAWHCEDLETYTKLFGAERAANMYRCKTVWDSGALVTWSSDTIVYMDFSMWNPYLGMEIGMTRWITQNTMLPEYNIAEKPFPHDCERMNIEEMFLGYTINGAKQLGIDDSKGSITAGKDADFLVFDNDLLTAEHDGFSHNKPSEVYFGGKKVN
jgi:hypothetical protein